MIIILFFTFLAFFLKYKKKPGVAKIIVGTYFISASFSLIKYVFNIDIEEPINEFAIIYYIVCLYILLYPFIKRGTLSFRDYEFHPKLINILSNVMLIGGLISLYYSIPKLFTLSTVANNLSDVRQLYYSGDDFVNSQHLSIIEVLSNLLLYVAYLTPVLCVYNFLMGRKAKSILLFISSLARPVSLMVIGEREAVVIWISNYFFSYFFFYEEFSKEIRNKIIKIGIAAFLPFILFVVFMTFSRFSSSEGGVMKGIFVYAGEQPFNFSYFFNHLSSQSLDGKLNFSFLYPKEQRLVDLQLNQYISSPKYLNVFSSLVGDYFIDFGYKTIIIVSLISVFFSLLFRIIGKSVHCGKLPFLHFFVLLFLYQYLFMGVFYNDVRTTYDIGMFILVFFCIYIYAIIFYNNKTIGREVLKNE